MIYESELSQNYYVWRTDTTPEWYGLLECQNALATLGIRHPVDTDSVPDVDVRHVLRGNEDILLAI